MRAMILERAGRPLKLVDRQGTEPGPGEIKLRVSACGVCRTDLHIIDGDLDMRRSPVVPGHEVIGRVAQSGEGVRGFEIGVRVGVPWLASTCGECRYCLEGKENLCDRAEFTGWSRDGGFAEEIVADARYCFAIPEGLSDAEAAPLMCAGLIGYRAWRMAGPPDKVRRLGVFGFGAAAHIMVQVARHFGQSVFAFTRPGDKAAQAFARNMGCDWAGNSGEMPPCELDAAILFAPAGETVPQALGTIAKGGTVVCGGIHMTDIPAFSYSLLWGERQIVSVANLTRRDALEFLPLAAKIGISPDVSLYPLERANDAISDLREGNLTGAAVLKP